jgi:hypothetical protein
MGANRVNREVAILMKRTISIGLFRGGDAIRKSTLFVLLGVARFSEITGNVEQQRPEAS